HAVSGLEPAVGQLRPDALRAHRPLHLWHELAVLRIAGGDTGWRAAHLTLHQVRGIEGPFQSGEAITPLHGEEHRLATEPAARGERERTAATVAGDLRSARQPPNDRFDFGARRQRAGIARLDERG